MKTCKSKKEEPTITIIRAIVQVGKPSRPLNYPCHICGIVGHKLTNFQCLTKCRTMFTGKKKGKIAKTKLVIKVKITSALVSMVDFHVTT
jgi:hypothetical protein